MSAWSAEEDSIMLDYGRVPVRELARRTGRSVSKVYDRARVLGLTRRGRGGRPYGSDEAHPSTTAKQESHP